MRVSNCEVVRKEYQRIHHNEPLAVTINLTFRRTIKVIPHQAYLRHVLTIFAVCSGLVYLINLSYLPILRQLWLIRCLMEWIHHTIRFWRMPNSQQSKQ